LERLQQKKFPSKFEIVQKVNVIRKHVASDNSYLFQNVPRPLDVEEDAIPAIPTLDQEGITDSGFNQTVAEAPEDYASQKVQTLQELDQSTKATLHHFLNMKYDNRGLDLSLLTGALSYPLDELEQDEDWSHPQFVRDLLNSIKQTKITSPNSPNSPSVTVLRNKERTTVL